MSMFDYLYACGFWQWVGTIALAGAIFGPLSMWFRVTVNSGMNSGCEYRGKDKP